ncbi:PQQ-dependent sugar dehydrogenase [Novipirellula sp.]|uniref:PQQ-dependent sugar dehydrogenase n=1 Tax=Novipirellula sp. TaxID=2795430 RepID=UPI0035663A74
MLPNNPYFTFHLPFSGIGLLRKGMVAGLLVLGLLSPLARADETVDPALSFDPVDTSRLMTSPYPYVLENAFPNLDFGDKGPLQLLSAPHDDQHVFVICRDGELHRFVNDPSSSETKLVFDISSKTAREGEEQGLLGFAFHPQYAKNGEVFASYATPPEYGNAAALFDLLIAGMFIFGAIVGTILPIPRRIAHGILLLCGAPIAGLLVFLVVPTAGLTGTQKKWIAVSVFVTCYVAIVFAYRLLMSRNEKIALNMAGFCGGLMGATTAAVLLTLLSTRFVDRSSESILMSRSVVFQSEVANRLARQTPEPVKHHLRALLLPPKGKLVVSRFQMQPDDTGYVDLTSEQVLLSLAYPSLSHYGGSIEFGPDGYLYLGTGDGMNQGSSQDLGTLHGSILRIDVDKRDPGLNYAIPKDNPFADVATRGIKRPEIWAYGLRNVWRLSFDQDSGRMWAGDVGLNRFEEVNLIRGGADYGWPHREGLYPYDAEHSWDMPAPSDIDAKADSQFVDPIITYDHRYGRAIVGGRVYRGDQFSELQGAYLYGDYASGMIWASYYDGRKVTRTVKLASPKVPLAGFGEDANREMYVCALDGIIYRFRKIQVDNDEPQLPFPENLSDTGLFSSVKNLTPVAGMIPYEVNVPMWCDGANQQRFLALPQAGQVEFAVSKPWRFPLGTVFVNHLTLPVTKQNQPVRRLETRLWVHGRNGWDGYTYVWNEDQSDASLIQLPEPRRLEVLTKQGPVERHWHFLTNEQCNVCHSKANGFVLGFNTRQLNRIDPDGVTNQIDRLEQMGIFRDPLPLPPTTLPSFADWHAGEGSIKEMARAYLAVNCAVCHVRDRLGITQIDLRYSTPLAEMKLVGMRPRRPKSERSAARESLVEPGYPEDSELLRRVTAEDEDRMPPLGRSIPDVEAAKVLAAWISGMQDDTGHFDPEVMIAMKPEVTRDHAVTESYDPAYVRKLAEEVRKVGDPNAGRIVFLSDTANCKSCHHVGLDEHADSFAKGPDLASVSTENSLESIIESVLWPQRVVKEGFELTAILLDDGRVVSGYVVSQTDNSMTIRDILTGNPTKVDKTSIEEYGVTGSAMPFGIANHLSRKQLCDLIAYLDSLNAPLSESPALSKLPPHRSHLEP